MPSPTDARWFNDLFIFNFADMKWKKCTFAPHRQMPAPRSGCQLAVHPSKDLIFVYGGYAKVKNVGEKSEGKVYADLWALNMAPILKRQEPTWEKLSRKGQAPSPRGGAAVCVHKQRFILFGGVFDEEKRRHTMQSTFYNDLFVYDMDRRRWFEFKLRGKKKEGEGKRRRKKKAANGGDEDADDDDDADDGEDEEEEEEEDFDKMLERQFGYVDEHGNIVYLEDEEEEEEKKDDEDTEIKMEHARMPDQGELFGEEEESKEEEKEDDVPGVVPNVSMAQTKKQEEEKKEEEEEQDPIPAPCPRINPAVIIRGSTLYVYGGVVEEGDREITLDDLWALDLKKLDEWKLLLPGTMTEQVWKGEVSETEESSDGDDDDEDDDDEEDDEEDEYDDGEKADTKGEKLEKKKAVHAAAVERAVEMLAEKEEDDEAGTEEKKKKKKKSKSKSSKNDRRAIRAEMEKLQEQLELDDANRTPQMGENLRDFFARTATYWATQVAQRPDTQERQLSVKEIKREGFAMAEVRYNELLPGTSTLSLCVSIGC